MRSLFFFFPLNFASKPVSLAAISNYWVNTSISYIIFEAFSLYCSAPWVLSFLVFCSSEDVTPDLCVRRGIQVSSWRGHDSQNSGHVSKWSAPVSIWAFTVVLHWPVSFSLTHKNDKCNWETMQQLYNTVVYCSFSWIALKYTSLNLNESPFLIAYSS